MSFGAIAKSLARYPGIGRVFAAFVSLLGIGQRQITIRLPGEMFLIFRKDAVRQRSG
jgi:hypothetical protein